MKPAGLAGVFEIAAKKTEAKKLEDEMSKPDFWGNRQAADELFLAEGEFPLDLWGDLPQIANLDFWDISLLEIVSDGRHHLS